MTTMTTMAIHRLREDLYDPYRSVDDVRHINAALDTELRQLAYAVPEKYLHDEFEGGHWTLAENLGHLGEFPGYYARQLREWSQRERTVVGRFPESDTDRRDALVRASTRRLAGLLLDIEAAFAELAVALDGLTDGHLLAHAHDVTIGRQSLTWFLDRYIIDHKRRHSDQLHRTLTWV